MTTFFTPSTLEKDFSTLLKRKEEISNHLNAFYQQNEIGLPAMSSQFLRPLVTYEIAKHLGLDENSKQLSYAALAVQTIHEASLFHDDVLDNANKRHHQSTKKKTKEALSNAIMQGDLLIAKSFQLIAKTNCLEAIQFYANCNRSVIAGEILQNSLIGNIIPTSTYENIISLKTGSLFASAASSAVYIFLQNNKKKMDEPKHNKILSLIDLSGEIGSLYQTLDDLLDFLPAANTGKEPFQDYNQQKFTFVLQFLPNFTWDAAPRNILPLLFANKDKKNTKQQNLPFSCPMHDALNYFSSKKTTLIQKLNTANFSNSILPSLLNFWENKAAVALQKTFDAHKNTSHIKD